MQHEWLNKIRLKLDALKKRGVNPLEVKNFFGKKIDEKSFKLFVALLRGELNEADVTE